MNRAAIWLAAEVLKITIQRLSAAGKHDTLTQEEAEAMAAKVGDSLSTVLPTPEELEAETPIP